MSRHRQSAVLFWLHSPARCPIPLRQGWRDRADRERRTSVARQHDQEHTEVVRGATGRPVVRGTHGIVASGHYLTSMAGMRMLLSGGNAFDAAVAMGFAAAVLEPTASYSLATEGVGMLYHATSGTMQGLSGQGVAPQAATVEALRARGLTKIPTGPGDQAHLSFTVPGIVDGYFKLLETYGTKTLGEVLAPAIDHAQHGFPMYEYMHRILRISQTLEQFQRYPAGGAEVFYPAGQVPAVGSLFVQPQLGQTLRLLAEAERVAPGPRRPGLQAARRMFYEGEIAHRIATFSERVGGLLRLEDLQRYQAGFEAPICTTFAGYEICTQSTWTQAAVLLQALNMLEHVDLRALGHNSPTYIHTLTEVLKLAFADRERYYGDPNCAAVPIAGLLSKAYAAERVKLVDALAYPGLPDPGDPARPGATVAPATLPWTARTTEMAGSSAEKGGPLNWPPAADAVAEGTTHLAALDREGNMVCITPSGGVFRKSAFVPELGCTLSTRSEMFFIDDDHANGLEPGKRPRTTVINYLVCRDG